MASAWSRVGPLVDLYVETARAVLVASRERSGADLVVTQGHVLTAADLCSTLAVEATVHHLDLGLSEPSGQGLGEARRTLDELLGRPTEIVSDTRYIQVGTGRETPNSEERALLGTDDGRWPAGRMTISIRPCRRSRASSRLGE
jgi:hypothetical protein